MLNLKEILLRADEMSIQDILGEQTIKILNLLNEDGIYLSELKRLILNLHSGEDLLSNPKYRKIIIDLLKLDEAKTIARILGVYHSTDTPASWYKTIKDLRYHRNSENLNTLFSIFNIQKGKTIIEEECISEITITVQYGLFEHQRVAARKVQNILNTGHERVLLHMPTGSGKTRTSMNIISDYLRANEKTLVIWLANTEELCEQAALEFEKAWTVLGNREISIYRHWKNHNVELSQLNEGLIVAGLQKLISSSKGTNGRHFMVELAKRISFVVFDEAHQSIAPVYNDIVSYLLEVGQPKKLIGLSATPGRSFGNIEEDQKLADFYHRKKVKLEVKGYANPIDYLTDAGYLAKANFNYIKHKNIPSLGIDDENKGSSTPYDYTKEILSKLAEDEQRNLLLVNQAIRLSKTHKRIILFAPSVECSNIISFILQSQGIHARSLTSNTDNSQRKLIINDFKNNDDSPKILCNYGVLTTGFDAPKTSAAIIGRPTTSLILYSQMVGRAIRGINAGGNIEAEIVTVIDEDLPGFRSVAEAFENWEDVWE
ncbi:DEAD/DEAH box helicase [Lysinibacillus boronitolerans]|uniref:DEAD/DEAH box helicase n=1 Tax=Lysinibacillus boronitolerans TaxID=309788 RepID=UPI00289B1931|nr:DEAD/DEAH box helicase family protein [Bacillus mobilis]